MLGGVIAYHNDVKRDVARRERGVAREHGAVSEPVVRQMAAGARARRPERDIGLAITGIAGPAGGTPEKPVGTVWIAADVDGDVQTRAASPLGRPRRDPRACRRSGPWTSSVDASGERRNSTTALAACTATRSCIRSA